jgi:hypothetical protein
VVYLPGAPGKVTGTLINPYVAINFERQRVYALAMDTSGKIIGGGSIRLDSVTAGSKTAVEISILTSATVSKVELYIFVRNLDALK